MSEEAVELVHRGFDAWNRGDFEEWTTYFHPGWEWRTAGLFPGMDSVYRGRPGLEKFWNAFREAWTDIAAEIERVEDLGDRVLVLLTFYGEGKESGVKVTIRYANVVTVRDGLAFRQVGYPDWESALESVGLE